MTTDLLHPPTRARWLPAGIAVLSAAFVVVWMGLGLLSLPGLLLLVLTAATAGLLVLASAPGVLVVLAPALLPLGLVWAVFPYELALAVLFAVVLMWGIETRPAWLFRLDPLEVANLAFVSWALATAWWSEDAIAWVLGARRLLEGVVCLWLGLRLAHVVPRRTFEYGVLSGTLLLTIVTLQRRFAAGIGEESRLDRASATDLGWGTSNFIATLLLLLTPPILAIVWRSSDRLLRTLGVLCVAAGGLLQVLIASRAAAVLFTGGLLAQLWTSLRRSRWIALAVVATGITGLVLSPFGSMLLSRFQNVRELGSMVVRIWYFRVAWQRTVENFPWGLGLNQGIVQADHLQNVDPHNYWLVLSSELGIPGLLLWAVVLVVLWRRLAAMARSAAWAAEGRALMISFWVVQLHTLVEPTFNGVQYQFVFFWLVGGYLGYFASETRALPRPAAWPSSSR